MEGFWLSGHVLTHTTAWLELKQVFFNDLKLLTLCAGLGGGWLVLSVAVRMEAKAVMAMGPVGPCV